MSGYFLGSGLGSLSEEVLLISPDGSAYWTVFISDPLISPVLVQELESLRAELSTEASLSDNFSHLLTYLERAGGFDGLNLPSVYQSDALDIGKMFELSNVR